MKLFPYNYFAMKLLQKLKKLIEEKVVYKNSKKMLPFIDELRGKVSKKSFITNEGLKLTYWHHKVDNSPFKVVFCHGNLFNLSHVENQKLLHFLTEKGYEFFALDYRGFGESGGRPDELGLYTDIESMIAHLSDKYKIENTKIILWGHSLGSAIVINAASKQNFAGIIVDSGFTSIEDMKNHLSNHYKNKTNFIDFLQHLNYKYLHISQKFMSKEKIAAISSPTLITHSESDELVPFEMGVALSKLKPDARTYFVKEGSHIIFGWQKQGVLDFLNEIAENSSLISK